jgi:hypothetical protein
MDNNTYEVVTTDEGTAIRLTEPDGTIWWIPEDENNRHYAEYLAYTAWVDEGNDPDEFWNNEEL